MRKQISIGTCIPGSNFRKWVPSLMDKGFENFTVNFHMSLGDENLDVLSKDVNAILKDSGKKIATLGFYCNALSNAEHEKTLHEAIDRAKDFGTDTVSTFAGGLEGESVDASMPRFKKVFSELVKHAEDAGVKLAVENCPMGGTWKKVTCNIGFNPHAWDMMFNEVPSDSLGLEWEPAHQQAQLIDPIANLRKYVHKIIHVHAKDATVKHDLIASEGIIGAAAPVDFRFPGFGDCDWRKVFEILQGAGYEGCCSIEGYHDHYFSKELEFTGQLHALKYLKWARGGEYIPNPWDK